MRDAADVRQAIRDAAARAREVKAGPDLDEVIGCAMGRRGPYSLDSLWMWEAVEWLVVQQNGDAHARLPADHLRWSGPSYKPTHQHLVDLDGQLFVPMTTCWYVLVEVCDCSRKLFVAHAAPLAVARALAFVIWAREAVASSAPGGTL
jgi:hypothetical protein